MRGPLVVSVPLRRPALELAVRPIALAAIAAALLGAVGVRWALAQAAEPGPAAERQRSDLPAPPATLPGGIRVGARNPELGKLQRSYRRLREMGLDEEAAELARQLGEPAGPAAGAATSFRPAAGVEAQFPGTREGSWRDCARQLVTFRFAGASAAEVAAFIQRETGLATKALAGAAPAAGFHGEVHGKPLGEALEMLGARISPRAGEIVLVPAAEYALRTDGAPLRR